MNYETAGGIAAAIATAFLVGVVAHAGGPVSRRATSARPSAPATSPACAVSIRGEVDSGADVACGPRQVHLLLSAGCPAPPVNLAYIYPEKVDEFRWVRQAAEQSVHDLAALQAGGIDVAAGVVTHWIGRASVAVPLTRDLGLVAQRVGRTEYDPRPDAIGDPRTAAATGLRMLRAARPAPGSQASIPVEFAVLFSQVKATQLGDTEALRIAADSVKSDGVTLVSACTKREPADACHIPLQLASLPTLYADARGGVSRLGQLLTHAIGTELAKPRVQGERMVQRLPRSLEFLDGTASQTPLAVTRFVTGTELVWASWPPTSTLSADLSYAVKPLSPGDHAITGELALVDASGHPHIAAMAPITLTELGPCITPSPTPGPTATRTPTPTPTRPPPTPTPTATASPTPRPTRVPAPVYLPLTLREACASIHQRADVVLVLDTSSSMAGLKLADAQAAALAFVGLMDLAPGRDQVAVLRFDTTAEAVQALTSDRAAVDGAIRGLTAREGTYIDRALAAAAAELASGRRDPANTAVAVLLTDGQQTGGPAPALAAADALRATGVRLYTIGLGADVDGATLAAMAGAAGRYRFAPDSGALAAIYAEIARDIQCPAEGLWPQGG